MRPILVEIPSLHITIDSYNALIVLAVLVCFAIGPRWIAALEALPPRRTLSAMLVMGVAAFAGARLHYVMNQWSNFADDPFAAAEIRTGGLHAAGGVALMAVTAPFVLRFLGLPTGKFLDGLTPTIGIGMAMARLGCFLAGCCYGTACEWPWCLSFPRYSSVYGLHVDRGLVSAKALHSLPVHPLQLYFMAVGLVITAVALWLHTRKRYDGEMALLALVVYSASAAGLELFRADHYERVYWGPLPQLEWAALAMTTASVVGLAIAETQHLRCKSHTGSTRPR